MTMSDDERIVRAAVAAPAQLPEDAIANVGDARTVALLSATTTIAIQRKFRSLPDQARIREFFDTLSARYPDGTGLLKPIVIEAVIRFAFGETDAIDGLDSDGVRAALFVLPYSIISEENIFGEPLDEFVAEVLKEVDAED